jgi:hypothetical protein
MQDESSQDEARRRLEAIAAAVRERGVSGPEEDDPDSTVRGLTLGALDALRTYYRDEIGDPPAYRVHAAESLFGTLADADPAALVWLATYAIVYLEDEQNEEER